MRADKTKGFTLLEVLIAMALVAAVVTMVITAISLARRGETKASEREKILQIQRSLYRNIVMPLRGIYPFYRRDEKGRPVLRFEGTSDTMAFVTTYTEPWTDTIANRPGLRWVKFKLQDNELKLLENLFFLEDPEEAPDEKVLYNKVEELRFEYLDPEEDIWLDEWPEDKNTLPSAIRVHLSFLYKNRTISLPPMVVHIMAQKRGI